MIAALISICAAVQTQAQHIRTLIVRPDISLRGLSVVNDDILWVSGSRGTVGKSLDGGKTWEWMSVPGYDMRDFRDIEAFDAKVAVIMAVAQPAHILRTVDGGKSWQRVYENTAKGMFLDAMDFSDDERGIVVGDVVNGRLFIARTFDGGRIWVEGKETHTAADTTEGCFAASGTNIRLLGDEAYYFVTGGLKSRLVSNSGTVVLPFDKSKATRGANSLAINRTNADHMIVVGGDFAADALKDGNCFVSRDRGRSWLAPAKPPGGYRSCVEFVNAELVVTCGLNGVDASSDGGNTWEPVSRDSFHTCRKAKKGDAVYLSGNNGRVAKLIYTR